MDNNKLSHKNPAVLSNIFNKIKKHFEDLSVVRGNTHNLLGMEIDMKYDIIQVYMVEQLEYIIKYLENTLVRQYHPQQPINWLK